MTSLPDSRMSASTAQASKVAVLCAHRGLESPVTQALSNAGLQVVAYGDAVSFACGLQAAGIEIALVEDHERLFQDCMTTLRFRGAPSLPIIAIGSGSANDIRAALVQGAADYVVQTESMESMVNRVLARLLMSRQEPVMPVLQAGDCWLEQSSRSLQYPGGETQLTPREFALAWVLFEQAGEVVNMNSLSQQAWGRDASITKRTIEQHVSRLRAKLIDACGGADRQVSLQAVHNIGYRLVVSRSTPPVEALDSSMGALTADAARSWTVDRRRPVSLAAV